MTDSTTNHPSGNPFTGFVLGMAVGDALGLPREGLSPRRARRLFGGPPLRHQFVFGRGMVSDDTEHLWHTAQALLEAPGDPSQFTRRLAGRLRWWLACLPAGVGLATARSIIRLWLGWSPERSGVLSAGNGPAMRAGILGLCLHNDEEQLRVFVRASTRLTHTDPRAESGAMMVALAARECFLNRATSLDRNRIVGLLRAESHHADWDRAFEVLAGALDNEETAAQFAARLNLQRGISGYIVWTVATVLFCWLRWPGEFRRPVEEIILLGGDTDTTAAILGGLCGAANGEDSIPTEWIDRIVDWPVGRFLLRDLSLRLAGRFGMRQPSQVHLVPRMDRFFPRFGFHLAVLLRNLCFLLIVLAHGARRLLPPY